MQGIIQYFANIQFGKAILWCYLIWYIVVVYFYFDPSPKVWINSIGISLVVGTALVLSVSSGNTQQQDYWQTFRLYLMPFCVSSFSTLIKNQGFLIVISPKIQETLLALVLCCLFLLAIGAIKFIKNKTV